LIDPSDGKVIGIAQKVLLTSVDGNFFGYIRDGEGNPKEVTGGLGATAKIGLVYGNTSQYFYGLHQRIKENHENGIQNTKYAIPTVGLDLIKLSTGPLDVTKSKLSVH